MTQIIGTFVDFDGMRAAFALRKNDLRLTNLEIDDIAGLQGGYTGKILCGMKRPGDMSLPALLGALGCELALVRASSTDREQCHVIQGRAQYRAKKNAHERRSNGGKRKALKMTSEERRKMARKMNKIRWSRERERHRAKIQPSVKEIASDTMSALL
jgi:hypothetical protein